MMRAVFPVSAVDPFREIMDPTLKILPKLENNSYFFSYFNNQIKIIIIKTKAIFLLFVSLFFIQQNFLFLN